MKAWIAFWNILRKDFRIYYLKPPNLSWGILFPLAWPLMFLIKSDSALDIRSILPGVVALSILFGATSILAVTITFEKKGRSFDRLLLAPISLEFLTLAKTSAAALFGVANGLVPVILAAFLTPMAGIAWGQFIAAVALIAVSSTFLGLLVAASVSEVFEAQTLSNFFRFPMIFLCGLFFPIERLPEWLRPVSYILPLTYGADALHAAVTEQSTMPCWLDLAVLAAFCVLLFLLSLRTIQRRWIA